MEMEAGPGPSGAAGEMTEWRQLRAQVMELSDRLRRARRQNDALLRELRARQQLVDDQSQQLAGALQRAHEADKLRARLAASEQELAEAVSAGRAAEALLQEASCRESALRGAAVAMMRAWECPVADEAASCGQMASLKEQLAAHERQALTAEQARSALAAEVADLRRLAATAEARAAKAEASQAAACTAVADLEAHIAGLQARSADVQSRLEARIAGLQAQLRAGRAEMEEWQTEAVRTMQDRDDLLAQVQKLQGQLGDANRAAAAEARERQSAAVERDIARLELASFQARAEELQAVVERLQRVAEQQKRQRLQALEEFTRRQQRWRQQHQQLIIMKRGRSSAGGLAGQGGSKSGTSPAAAAAAAVRSPILRAPNAPRRVRPTM